MRRSVLVWALLGAQCLLASGCTWGVQQLVFSPAVGGQYTFSGTRVRVQSPPGQGTGSFDFDLAMDPRVGRIDELRAFPQLALGFDTPRWRATVNPSLTGQDDLSHLQLDLFYKHPLLNTPHTAVRLLAGLSYASMSVDVVERSVLVMDGQIDIEGAIVQSGDELTYKHSASDAGVFASGGLELELTEWLHLFATVSVRLNSSQSTSESLDLDVRNGSTFGANGARERETFHVFEDDRFKTTITQAGALSSTVELPPLVAMVGVAIVLPTWSWIERTFWGTPPPPANNWGPPPDGSAPPPARPSAPPGSPGSPQPQDLPPEGNPPPAQPYPG